MCTAFVKKGIDLIVGFNFDYPEDGLPYRIYKNKELFYIGMKVGSTIHKIHGVNRSGNTGNLPYMNPEAPEARYRRGGNAQRIDLLCGNYIAGKLSYPNLLELVRTKSIVNVLELSMHSQFTDAKGHILIVEPGLGACEVEGEYSIITNFPVLKKPFDCAGNGAERYRIGSEILKNSDRDFSAKDGLMLLNAVKQEGEWATRISFVYSKDENAVYYTENGDFGNVQKHQFKDETESHPNKAGFIC